MPKIEADMRERIAKFLPRAFATALSIIEKIQREPISKDHKTNKERQDAVKAVLAHLQMFLKLAEHADLPDPEIEGQSELQALMSQIQSAQDEINAHKPDYEDIDE